MKGLVFAFVALMSLPAFANICSQSWDDIYRAGYTAQFPKVKMDSVSSEQVGTVFVSVDGLCIDGDQLKTQSATPVCLESAKDEAGKCVRSKQAVLSTDISYVADLAMDESGRTTRVPSVHPTRYDIPVGTDGHSFRQVCTKSFAIKPTCGK